MNINYTKHTLFQIELRTEEQLHNDAGQVQVGFTWRVLWTLVKDNSKYGVIKLVVHSSGKRKPHLCGIQMNMLYYKYGITIVKTVKYSRIAQR